MNATVFVFFNLKKTPVASRFLDPPLEDNAQSFRCFQVRKQSVAGCWTTSAGLVKFTAYILIACRSYHSYFAFMEKVS